MSKLKVLDKKSEKSINSERELLSKLHNPFIVNMHYAFQDSENLYLIMKSWVYRLVRQPAVWENRV